MRVITRFVALAALSLSLSMSTTAAADVVMLPEQGYTDEVGFGEATFDTAYRTPNGIPYRRALGPKAGITRHAVGWAPKDLPIYMETGVDARGAYLLLSTLLADPDGISACWNEAVLNERGAALRARLNREFARWADGCQAVRTLGAQRVLTRWTEARRDINRALARLAAVRRARYLADPLDGDGRLFGVPSFLPQSIDQPVLDAIAEQCGLPRARLVQQEGGTISFRPAITGTQESSADARVNMCVTRAIEYLPGYRPRA